MTRVEHPRTVPRNLLRPTDYAQQKGTSGDAPQIPRYRPGMLNPRHKDDSSS